MLKKTISYEDFNGNKMSEDFHFNLTKVELFELERAYDIKGGIEALIQRIIETQDKHALIDEFKRLIDASFGVKSDDGKKFLKSPELLNEFKQHAAYDEVFIMLATDAEFAAEFFKGILPKDLAKRVDAQVAATPADGSLAPPAL